MTPPGSAAARRPHDTDVPPLRPLVLAEDGRPAPADTLPAGAAPDPRRRPRATRRDAAAAGAGAGRPRLRAVTDLDLPLPVPLPRRDRRTTPAPTPARTPAPRTPARGGAAGRFEAVPQRALRTTAAGRAAERMAERRRTAERTTAQAPRPVPGIGGAPARVAGGPAPAPRRRRPVSPAERLGPRPDRIAAWAVVLGLAMLLLAATTGSAATAGGTSGDPVPRSGSHAADRPGPTATSSRAKGRFRYVPLGTRTLHRGHRGTDVRTLQRLLAIPADGVFGRGTARAVRRFQRESGLTADGKVGPATRAALARRRMRIRDATYYGPGLYGNTTACGQRMTRRLRGVAHRSLPCGRRVVLSIGGRFTTVEVVDRGPFRRGYELDLTAATARDLGFGGSGPVRARY